MTCARCKRLVAALDRFIEFDLDEPVRTYLPRFDVADNRVSGAITVRHLLRHTSGCPISPQPDLDPRPRWRQAYATFRRDLPSAGDAGQLRQRTHPCHPAGRRQDFATLEARAAAWARLGAGAWGNRVRPGRPLSRGRRGEWLYR